MYARSALANFSHAHFLKVASELESIFSTEFLSKLMDYVHQAKWVCTSSLSTPLARPLTGMVTSVSRTCSLVLNKTLAQFYCSVESSMTIISEVQPILLVIWTPQVSYPLGIRVPVPGPISLGLQDPPLVICTPFNRMTCTIYLLAVFPVFQIQSNSFVALQV